VPESSGSNALEVFGDLFRTLDDATSSILIADERGRFALPEFFAAHLSDTFRLAAITISELWHGVVWATPPARTVAREGQLRQWLTSVPVLSFGDKLTRVWLTRAAAVGFSHNTFVKTVAAIERIERCPQCPPLSS